jgi:hypothetical protein
VPSVVDGLGHPGVLVSHRYGLCRGPCDGWPILAPNPAISRVSLPWKIGFLLATVVPTIPAAFLTFADFPIYALYEPAPRVHGIPRARISRWPACS